jgi:hypothetical protein
MSNATSIPIPKLNMVFTALAALGGLTAFLIYLENKKQRKTQEEVLELDKQIKSLQLKKLQS